MTYADEIQSYFDKLKQTIDEVDKNEINDLLNVLVDAYENDKQVFLMGNGGSGSTASHFVCDYNKGIALDKPKRFKLICLNDNIPSMLAYANDLSFEDIFVQQLKSYFNLGDVVIGISGSGNSENVIRAIEFANNDGGMTVGLTGYDGGKLRSICQKNVHVPIADMQVTEDLHLILCHLMMQVLMKNLA